ncbi:hypothetical protein N6G05_13685 [Cupriavidus gilardii]|uniref:hypothetical protein n=1 Tax=Cupriavidus gilardii TaxID=82541 RepID=UPI0021C0DEAA|nr:hypothetical protein [Cupriavidus gilardii]MCT9014612.1 hypothetical protein [Cupriavidus gilardii]MCT9054332.1 hypothetical protein [Cupriavidus gilardii]
MSEKKRYEVLERVRLYRRSREVGAIVHAYPDDVSDLVGTTLRELADDDSGADQTGEDTSGPAAALAGTAPQAADGHAPTAPSQEGSQVASEAKDLPPSEGVAKPATVPSDGAADGQKRQAATAKRAATKGKGRK